MSESRDLETQAGMCYVWGYQDALKDAGVERDSNDAYLFGQAWGKACQLYREEKVYHRPTMQAAFKMWRENDKRIRLTDKVSVYAQTSVGVTTIVVQVICPTCDKPLAYDGTCPIVSAASRKDH